MNYGSSHMGKSNPVMAPIAIISLFTLSAAVMAYIFLYQPFQLYFDNHKKAAIDLFLKTLMIFGVTTFLLVTILFSGVFSSR